MSYFILLLLFFSSFSCQKTTEQKPLIMKKDITTTQEQWKEILTEQQYYVLREKGTERAFTGQYNDFWQKGSYHCAACDNLLFDAETKYDAHCGWPSFDKAIQGSVKFIEDRSHGMIRTEVVCANCNSHLGHIFEDGPTQTTGQRYCMNSISLTFKATP